MTTSKPRRAWALHHTPGMSLAALAAGAIVCGSLSISPAAAQALGYANDPVALPWPGGNAGVAGTQRQVEPEARDVDVLPPHLRRQIVDYATSEAPGTIVIDTPHTVLYYVLGGHRAIRYGVGVGREGFTWSGTEIVSRKAQWPDWIPPSEMIARQPYLPRFVAGGPGNPLGARAMYLGASKYRIHGTNDPTTIGKFVSSGCIRLTNTDVEDLFSRVEVGTKVVVLPKVGRASVSRVSLPVPQQVSRVQTSQERPGAAQNVTGAALY